MFCQQCGTELGAESKFCPQCGTSLIGAKQVTEAAVNDESNSITQVQVPEHNGIKSRLQEKTVLIPLITGICMIILVSGLYIYELNVSKSANNMRIEAENLALHNKISQAAQLVAQGLAKRPHNQTLLADQKFLADGLKTEDYINQVNTHIKKQSYPYALTLLDQARTAIAKRTGPFYTMLNKQLDDKKTGVSVLQIKSEMKDENSIDELADLLTRVSAFNVPEAKDTAANLKSKIGTIAYNQANDFLNKKDFTSALNVVNRGLQYDTNDSKLISCKDTINKKQQEFQQTEQQRIEQAMVAAAQEDMSNHNNAVKVLQLSGSLDQYGDYLITGQIQNIATRPIDSVEIFYTIYDADNAVLGSDYTYVYPNYLNPNDTAYLSNTEYGVPGAARVVITKVTWVVD